MKIYFIAPILLIITFFTNTHGQGDIQLKIFPERMTVSHVDPNLELILVIKNFSKRKIALLAPEIVNVGADTTFYWNLNVCINDERKIILKLDNPCWRDCHKYFSIRPLQMRCFPFQVNFKELKNKDLMHGLSIEQTISLAEVLKKENNDFGDYKITLEYFDKKQKRSNALTENLISNIVKIKYVDD